MFVTGHGINGTLPAICRDLLWMKEEPYVLLGFMIHYSTVNFIALVEPHCYALQWLLPVFNSLLNWMESFPECFCCQTRWPLSLLDPKDLPSGWDRLSQGDLYLYTFRTVLLFSVYFHHVCICKFLKINAIV